MNKKVAFIVVFLLILVVARAGFLRWQNQKKVDIEKRVEIQQQLEQESKKQEELEKTKEESQANQDDGSIEYVVDNWKVYQNTKYTFELKYPKNWELEVLNTDFNKKGNDLFFFKKDEKNYFAVFPKGGLGYGIEKPQKTTEELFAGKKAKMRWYKYPFPLYIYIIDDLPKSWASGNWIDIRISDDNRITIEEVKSIYASFRFIEE